MTSSHAKKTPFKASLKLSCHGNVSVLSWPKFFIYSFCSKERKKEQFNVRIRDLGYLAILTLKLTTQLNLC